MANPNWINQFKEINLPINSGLESEGSSYLPPFEFAVKGRGAYDYQWIFVLSCILAFICAAGIGANDVANSFATSVGSKTLKMWQAIVVAGVCEFLGAYLLGARVTATIRSGIVSISAFKGHEDLLMFGMMCAILVVGIFLFVATAFELPVSTTHSIIGAIIGFALCSPAAAGAVQWTEVGKIIGSWFVSPILTGLLSAGMFTTIRWIILRRKDALRRVFIFFPVLVFFTITLNVIFILFKGGVTSGQGISGAKLTDSQSVGIAFGVGAICAILVAVCVNPKLKTYINGLSEEDLILIAANNGSLQLTEKDQKRLFEIQAERLRKAEEATALAAKQADPEGGAIVDPSAAVSDEQQSTISSSSSSVRKIGKWEQRLDRMFSQEFVHSASLNDAHIAKMHDDAEIFPLQTELAFGYLQVATACFASFAHGANDVANSIGPLAAIYAIYTMGAEGAARRSPVPDWILVLGGAGIVFGLAVYGHIIIAAMGTKMTKITPARGFCAELSVALVIVIGSFLALPLSSTQCAVGAIVGLGVAEGRKDAVNWKLLGRVFLGWVATLFIAGGCTAAIFSWSTFSPSQVYPMSLHNCLAYYGDIHNVTKGAPTSYTQVVNDGNTIVGIWGYPSNGTMYQTL